MTYRGTGYSTLDDLENRLDKAVQSGELTEQEAWDEFQYAAAHERDEQSAENFNHSFFEHEHSFFEHEHSFFF